MAKTIENLFYFAHFIFDFIVILLYFLFFKKARKEAPLTLITVYVFLDSSLNILDKIFPELYLYVWSSFTLIEYCIFTYILSTTITKKYIKKTVFYLSVCFIVFSVIYNIITHFKKFDSIPVGVETILILLFSFYYLYEQMNNTTNLFIYNKYQFWIIIGFMIYLAGSFFVFIFTSGLNNSNSPLLNQYWTFTNGFYFLMLILFSISLILYAKQPKNKFPNKLVLS